MFSSSICYNTIDVDIFLECNMTSLEIINLTIMLSTKTDKTDSIFARLNIVSAYYWILGLLKQLLAYTLKETGLSELKLFILFVGLVIAAVYSYYLYKSRESKFWTKIYNRIFFAIIITWCTWASLKLGYNNLIPINCYFGIKKLGLAPLFLKIFNLLSVLVLLSSAFVYRVIWGKDKEESIVFNWQTRFWKFVFAVYLIILSTIITGLYQEPYFGLLFGFFWTVLHMILLGIFQHYGKKDKRLLVWYDIFWVLYVYGFIIWVTVLLWLLYGPVVPWEIWYGTRRKGISPYVLVWLIFPWSFFMFFKFFYITTKYNFEKYSVIKQKFQLPLAPIFNQLAYFSLWLGKFWKLFLGCVIVCLFCLIPGFHRHNDVIYAIGPMIVVFYIIITYINWKDWHLKLAIFYVAIGFLGVWLSFLSYYYCWGDHVPWGYFTWAWSGYKEGVGNWVYFYFWWLWAQMFIFLALHSVALHNSLKDLAFVLWWMFKISWGLFSVFYWILIVIVSGL